MWFESRHVSLEPTVSLSAIPTDEFTYPSVACSTDLQLSRSGHEVQCANLTVPVARSPILRSHAILLCRLRLGLQVEEKAYPHSSHLGFWTTLLDVDREVQKLSIDVLVVVGSLPLAMLLCVLLLGSVVLLCVIALGMMLALLTAPFVVLGYVATTLVTVPAPVGCYQPPRCRVN